VSSLLKEFTGQLIGGPDDGNYVTASTARIPVTHTIKMWLDGKEEGKTVSISVTEGVYLWQADNHTFKWDMHSVNWFKTVAEPV